MISSRAPQIGDLVEWFETTALVVDKRGIDILIAYRDKTMWVRRAAVEILSESR